MDKFIHNNSWGLFNLNTDINNLDLKAYIERLESYFNNYQHMLNIAMSRFKCNDEFEEKGIDSDFFLKVLIESGKVAFTDKTDIGLMCSAFNVNTFDYQNRPSKIVLIPYYSKGQQPSIIGNGILTQGDFEVVYLNKNHVGLSSDLSYFSTIHSMLHQLKLNNIIANSLQLVFQGKKEDKLAFNEIINSMFNQNGYLFLNSEKGDKAEEIIKNISKNFEWLCDKVNEEETHNLNALYSRLGINHINYEKKERLTDDEAQANLQYLNLISENMLSTIKKGLNKVNNKYGTNFDVEYAETLESGDDNVTQK